MKRTRLCLVALVAVSSWCGAGSLPWEAWNDPSALAQLGGGYGSYLTSSYCLDGCRYDRTSVDPGRGGPRFVRIESTPQGRQGVVFEQPGAGVVTRIWMTTGEGTSQPLPADVRLRVYVDGEAIPAIDEPLDRFFRDPQQRHDTAPLAMDRLLASGGNVSYKPLAYRNGIRIALLNGVDRRLWYQINHAQVPVGTPVPAFAEAVHSLALAQRLAAPEIAERASVKRLPFGRDRRPREPIEGAASARLQPGEPLELLRASGYGMITAFHLRLDRARWDDVRLTLAFDGRTTVDLPVAAFFTADAGDQMRPAGVFAGVDGRGAFYAAMPMPFWDGAVIALHLRDGANRTPVDLDYRIEHSPFPPPPHAESLHAQAHVACPTAPAAGGDAVLLEHRGRGRLIGLAAWMSGDGTRAGGYYLEGDERLYIDGSVQPLWYGTGVEDFFNGGFYFDRGAYAGPLSGAPLRFPGGVSDATSMYRWFLADAPSWRNSVVLKLESGARGDEPLCLRTVAFFYASPRPAQEIVATLQLGDAPSEAAARYRRGVDAICSAQTALFGDEPPTKRTAHVCRSGSTSRFTLSTPRRYNTQFRLRRTFDAGTEGQAAEIFVNGVPVGAWPDTQANPARRWSQMDVDFTLPFPASILSFDIRPLPGRTVSESRYELFAPPLPGSGN